MMNERLQKAIQNLTDIDKGPINIYKKLKKLYKKNNKKYYIPAKKYLSDL